MWLSRAGFRLQGVCVRVPGNERPPHVARVRSYPIEARYGFVWIWMGDRPRPTRLDSSKPSTGMMRAGARPRRELMCRLNFRTSPTTCSILRTSPGFMPRRSPTPVRRGPAQDRVLDDGVVRLRWMLDTQTAPFYQQSSKSVGNSDREQHYEVRFPATRYQGGTFTAGDLARPGTHHPDTFLMDCLQFHDSDRRTHTRYFWFQMRNVAPDDDEVSQRFATPFAARSRRTG